jgi:hypothetical protein
VNIRGKKSSIGETNDISRTFEETVYMSEDSFDTDEDEEMTNEMEDLTARLEKEKKRNDSSPNPYYFTSEEEKEKGIKKKLKLRRQSDPVDHVQEKELKTSADLDLTTGTNGDEHYVF